MNRRDLWLLAALAVLVMPVFAGPFADMPSHWAYQEVSDLADLGVLQGYPDGLYRGRQPMSRYEYAQATARLLDQVETRLQAGTPDQIRAFINEHPEEIRRVNPPLDAQGPVGPPGPPPSDEHLRELIDNALREHPGAGIQGQPAPAGDASRLRRLDARLDDLEARVDALQQQWKMLEERVRLMEKARGGGARAALPRPAPETPATTSVSTTDRPEPRADKLAERMVGIDASLGKLEERL